MSSKQIIEHETRKNTSTNTHKSSLINYELDTRIGSCSDHNKAIPKQIPAIQRLMNLESIIARNNSTFGEPYPTKQKLDKIDTVAEVMSINYNQSEENKNLSNEEIKCSNKIDIFGEMYHSSTFAPTVVDYLKDLGNFGKSVQELLTESDFKIVRSESPLLEYIPSSPKGLPSPIVYSLGNNSKTPNKEETGKFHTKLKIFEDDQLQLLEKKIVLDKVPEEIDEDFSSRESVYPRHQREFSKLSKQSSFGHNKNLKLLELGDISSNLSISNKENEVTNPFKDSSKDKQLSPNHIYSYRSHNNKGHISPKSEYDQFLQTKQKITYEVCSNMLSVNIKTLEKSFYNSGEYFLTIDTFGILKQWDPQEKHLDLNKGKVFNGIVESMLISQCSRYLFISGRKGLLRQWNIKNNNLYKDWGQIHKGIIYTMAFTKDNKY